MRASGERRRQTKFPDADKEHEDAGELSGEDLLCPLDHKILKKAYAELTRKKTDKTRYKALVELA